MVRACEINTPDEHSRRGEWRSGGQMDGCSQVRCLSLLFTFLYFFLYFVCFVFFFCDFPLFVFVAKQNQSRLKCSLIPIDSNRGVLINPGATPNPTQSAASPAVAQDSPIAFLLRSAFY